MMVRLALFDVDGTLVDSQTYSPLTKLLWARPRLRPRMVRLFLQLMPGHLRRHRSLRHRLASQRGWAVGYARLLAGMTIEEVSGIMGAACRALGPKLRPEVLRELAARRAEGCLIVLASTALMPLLDRLGPMVGAVTWSGTPLEIKGGRYTGRLGGPLCNGAEKIAYVQARVKATGDEIDWAGSYAYSDGLSDLPMLEKVGHAVVVAPDPALAVEATKRGWPTLPTATTR